MSLIPATDDRAAERKRFHTWCEERGVDCTLWMPNQPWCGYSNSRTQDYWEGWCARADADGVEEPAMKAAMDHDVLTNLALTDGDRRLIDLLTKAGLARSPAMDDLMALIFVARSKRNAGAPSPIQQQPMDSSFIGNAGVKTDGGRDA